MADPDGVRAPVAQPTAASHSSDDTKTAIVFLCAFLGLWGVLSGCFAFSLILDEAHPPVVFAGALLLAAILSLGFEAVRELIQHGHLRDPEDWSIPRILMTFLTLAMFEFFIMAAESGVKAYAHMEVWRPVAEAITGHPWEESRGSLLIVAGLWMILGAVLAGSLSVRVFEAKGQIKDQMKGGACTGAIVGLIVAPLALLAYALTVRLFGAFYLLLFNQKVWKANLARVTGHMRGHEHWGWHIAALPLGLIERLQALWGDRWLGPPVTLAIAVAVIVWCGRKKLYGLMWGLVALLVVVVMAPLLGHLGDVFRLMALAAASWLIPGVSLGAMVPLLRRPSEVKAGWWALVAFAGAGVLLIVTAARLGSNWWFLLPAALLVAVGIALYRRGRIEDYWPIMALSIAIIMSGLAGVSHKLQDATFAGTFRKVYTLNTLPSDLAGRTPASQGSEPRPDLEETQKPPQGSMGPAPRNIPGLQGEKEAREEYRKQLDRARELRDRIEALQKAEEQHYAKSREQIASLNVEERLKELDAKALLEQLAGIAALQSDPKSIRSECETKAKEIGELLADVGRVDATVAWAAALEKRPEEKVDRATNPLVKEAQALSDGAVKFKGEVERLTDQLRGKERDYAASAARWLEEAITGSLGFWVTLGLLAAWSIYGHMGKATCETSSPTKPCP